MFGIGWIELLSLILAWVLYLGAKHLPEAGKNFGDTDYDLNDHPKAGIPQSPRPQNQGSADDVRSF